MVGDTPVDAPVEKNSYDSRDHVRRETLLLAGPLKLAAYTVRDPETMEHGQRQFHMTYDNTVMAVMSEEAAKLFSTMVRQIIGLDNEETDKIRQLRELIGRYVQQVEAHQGFDLMGPKAQADSGVSFTDGERDLLQSCKEQYLRGCSSAG